MKKLLFIIFLFLFLLPRYEAVGQKRSVTYGPVSVYFGNYKPREPKSLSELPESIRVKLETHLKARLGDAFYSRLRLSSGQLIDFDELYRVEPDAKNYKWKIFAYGLNFKFSEPAKGIRAYHSRISLDENGNVLQEIDLPEIAKHPEKANIISLSKAKKIASEHKFPLERTDVEINYDSERDSLIWMLKYKLKGNAYVWVTRSISIDAHTGEILSLLNSEEFF